MTTASAVMKRTEGDVGQWIKEVLDGKGSSPAQMIITTVLGCIPYVGQALDARNIIIALMDIAEDPSEGEHWLDLVLSLIALVPGFGDALKNVFKLLRTGKPLGRILDALPNSLRGNVERWLRALDWVAYTRDLQSLTHRILGELIGVLDGWLTRAVMGKARVQALIRQLNDVKALATRKIDEVMGSLKASYQRALKDPLPTTTAHAHARTATPKLPPPRSQAGGGVRRTSGGNYTPAQGRGGGQHRQSKPRNNKRTGSSAEHITDYYFVKRNKSRGKISNHGVLWEYAQPGHNGIDHIWHQASLPFKYRVTDTKGTGNPRHRLMTPKAFYDNARMGIDVFLGWEDEGSVRNATPRATVGDGKEMSHTWVVRKVASAGLTNQHRPTLSRAIKQWESDFDRDASGKWKLSGKAPYDRSFVTVVRSNFDLHDLSKVGVDLPKCSRPVRVHQIATEFVLPTEIYFE